MSAAPSRHTSSGVQAYLTVAEACELLHRKPWPLIEAIEAGELRASQPSNDGAWLIRPDDLGAYVDAFANYGPGSGKLGTREERRERLRRSVAEELAESDR